MPIKGSRQPHLCKKCGEERPSEFYGFSKSECKKCAIARGALRQRGNHEHHRRRHMRRAYGITPEIYDEMLAKQQGLCAICGEPPREDDLQKFLVVDHDHQTGEIRGLVHGRCNAVLGYAQDRPEILFAAARYLASHERKATVTNSQKE